MRASTAQGGRTLRGAARACRCIATRLATGGGRAALFASSSAAAPASAAAGGSVKVAFITKFPVAFFTAMDDAAKMNYALGYQLGRDLAGADFRPAVALT